MLSALAPASALATDSFGPLMEIWQTLHASPERLKLWYEQRWSEMMSGDKKSVYHRVRNSYNQNPNGADLLFLCRSCYGGVVRFRQADGYMSTPCGIHSPIPPAAFSKRVDEWSSRTANARFACMEYQQAMSTARRGDLVYCDPPYAHSQPILYGAQRFDLEELFQTILECKKRGVFVALSIDGTKRSGDLDCILPIPSGLFDREILIDCGRSMLKRFQMNGQTLDREVVHDRLLLTF